MLAISLHRAYDAARPTYPPQLFSDAKQLAPPGDRAADVGCGTGRGAIAMARLGYGVAAEGAPRHLAPHRRCLDAAILTPAAPR